MIEQAIANLFLVFGVMFIVGVALMALLILVVITRNTD